MYLIARQTPILHFINDKSEKKENQICLGIYPSNNSNFQVIFNVKVIFNVRLITSKTYNYKKLINEIYRYNPIDVNPSSIQAIANTQRLWIHGRS